MSRAQTGILSAATPAGPEGNHLVGVTDKVGFPFGGAFNNREKPASSSSVKSSRPTASVAASMRRMSLYLSALIDVLPSYT